MYKYHCINGHWFEKEKVLLWLEGYQTGCPECLVQDYTEKDACDNGCPRACHLGENYCSECIIREDYEHTYRPSLETLLELSLTEEKEEKGPMDYDPTAGRYYR